MIYKNARLAWWFHLLFGLLGILAGVTIALQSHALWQTILGLGVLGTYFSGLSVFIWASISDRWGSFCVWANAIFS